MQWVIVLKPFFLEIDGWACPVHAQMDRNDHQLFSQEVELRERVKKSRNENTNIHFWSISSVTMDLLSEASDRKRYWRSEYSDTCFDSSWTVPESCVRKNWWSSWSSRQDWFQHAYHIVQPLTITQSMEVHVSHFKTKFREEYLGCWAAISSWFNLWKLDWLPMKKQNLPSRAFPLSSQGNNLQWWQSNQLNIQIV